MESPDAAEWGGIDARLERRIVVLLTDGVLAVIYLYSYLIV